MSATSVEQRTTWKLDTNNTTVEFSVKKFMVTNVKGRFAAFTGTITADEAKPELSSVNVSIDVASVDTRDEKRDAHLKSADFFDVETYPALSFESTRVERTGDEQFRVIGNLTIRDTTREVALDTTFHGIGHTPWNTQVAAFTAETTVNRRDYGLVWNMPLEKGGVLVGDTIKISLEVQATKQQA
jgi:polyisoprenoid-binding protein YceI